MNEHLEPLPYFVIKGNVITVNDLPDPSPGIRWTTKRKAMIALAVRHKLLTREEVLSRYCLDERDLTIWLKDIDIGGVDNLRVTRIKERAARRK